MSLERALVVELVGRGGAGKTTIAGILRESGIGVLYVSRHRILWTRIRAGLAACKHGFRYRLSPRELLSLFRKCSSVEQGMAATAKHKTGVIVVDEGPMRGLRDIRCYSFAERRAWWSYAQVVLERIARRPARLLVVHLVLDESTRQERHEARTRAEARTRRKSTWLPLTRLTGVTSTKRLIPPIRFAVKIASARVLGPAYLEYRLSIGSDVPPEEVAWRVADYIRKLP